MKAARHMLREVSPVLIFLFAITACSRGEGRGIRDDRLSSPLLIIGGGDHANELAPIHDPAIAKAGDTYYVYSSSPLASFVFSRPRPKGDSAAGAG